MEDTHQRVRREKGARREQITDHAEQQVRKGLTASEESRDHISRAGTTDDGLQRDAQAPPACQDSTLLIIKPMEVSLRETAITLGKGRGDRMSRKLRAMESVAYPFASEGIIEARRVAK